MVGERRSASGPLAEHPIDILGEGGFCVAPPSVRSDGGRYEFVRGGLSDLANLPTMRLGAMQIPETVKPSVNPSRNVAPIGKRNDTVSSGWHWLWPTMPNSTGRFIGPSEEGKCRAGKPAITGCSKRAARSR